jgi:uncharacterized protein YaiE (UPF0345 family)
MNSFPNVTVDSVANIYFEGKVVSHTIHFPDGSRKTLGIIAPGSFYFGTAAAEIMEITAGSCEVTIKDSGTTQTYAAGTSFQVPANSGFDIKVNDGLCQYICSFLS